MKRIIGFGIVAALLLALPAAHTALAKGHKPDPKVHICHITGEGVRADGTELWVGHVIEISENALAAHCAHGVGDHNPNAMGPVGSLCGRAKTANVPCTGLIY